MLTGGIIFAAGFIITFWTYSSALNGGTYVVAWGAIIFGAIRFFRGMSNTEKYKAVISNIQTENNTEAFKK